MKNTDAYHNDDVLQSSVSNTVENNKVVSMVDKAASVIRERNLRTTKDRVIVLAELISNKNPMSHGDLFALLTSSGIRMDRVTLYRILEWLTNNKILYRISGHDRVWRFAYNTKSSGEESSHNHAHFHCNKCGGYVYLSNIAVPNDISLPEGYSKTGIDLTITGTCCKCVS